jgi:hypothetical protein
MSWNPIKISKLLSVTTFIPTQDLKGHIFQKQKPYTIGLYAVWHFFPVFYKKRKVNVRSKWSKVTKWEYLICLIIHSTHKMLKAQMKVFQESFWYPFPLMSWSTQLWNGWILIIREMSSGIDLLILDGNTQKRLSKPHINFKVLN